jgi:hypothetical protein
MTGPMMEGGCRLGWATARLATSRRDGRQGVAAPHCRRPAKWRPPACTQIVYGTRPHQRLPDVPSAPHCKIMTLDRVRALGYKHPKPHQPPKVCAWVCSSVVGCGGRVLLGYGCCGGGALHPG